MADTAQGKPQGLTAAEVAERVRLGLVNQTRRSDWAEYADIVRRNVLTVFNAIVAPAAVALFWLGEWKGAVAVSGFAIINTLIGLVQEIRAKRHLDKLAILVETKARVVRDGKVEEIPAAEVVQGDCIQVAGGEAIVADGPVLDAQFLEVDEALLTGESDPVRRKPGDLLLSGSFCVAGEGAYRADKVGGEAFAQSTSAEARTYRYSASPLQKSINRILQLLTAAVVGMCLVYVALYFMRDLEVKDLVQMVAATITSMVPQGLVVMATLAFTLGAVHMSSQGAVVQQLNAVESMASVDVVCTDKTGTLTTNRLKFDRMKLLPGSPSEEAVRQQLREFSWATMDQKNKSIQALREALGKTEGAAPELIDQLPFKSQNRYSAVRVKSGKEERVLAMGAWEALKPHLKNQPGEWEAAWKEMLATGMRILLFADSDRRESFNGSLDGFPLRPLALVALSDELRPEAGQVLVALAGQGIAFKILSGDNPDTVRATVAHLDLPLAREPVVSGDELAKAADPTSLILTRSVFGRVAPKQKVLIVETLKEHGHHVAMIGDGVNDVLPIKRSDLGIAMGEGSQASKTVSGLVLENNNFALLPETLEEGRTIIRNLRRSGKLFLLKNAYSGLLILGTLGLFQLPFPFLPEQVTLLNLLTIGIPAFVITLSRERSTAATRTGFVKEVGWFAIRTGVIIAAAGLTIMLIADAQWPWKDGKERIPAHEELQRTLLLSTLVLLGTTALLRVLTDGETQPLVGDTKFRWLAIGAVPVYLLAMYLPWPADYFSLVPLNLGEWALVLAVAGAGYLACLGTDRIGRNRSQEAGVRGQESEVRNQGLDPAKTSEK